jgi:hypothetical protein
MGPFSSELSFEPFSAASRGKVRRLVCLAFPPRLAFMTYRGHRNLRDEVVTALVNGDVFLNHVYYVPEFLAIVSINPVLRFPRGFRSYSNPVLLKDSVIRALPIMRNYSLWFLPYTFSVSVSIHAIIRIEKHILFGQVENELGKENMTEYIIIIDKLFGKMKRNEIVDVLKMLKRCHGQNLETVAASIESFMARTKTISKKVLFELLDC